MTSNRASVPDIRDPAILKGCYAGGRNPKRAVDTPGVQGTRLTLYASIDEHAQLMRSSGIAD
jgi:hypothetical protein